MSEELKRLIEQVEKLEKAVRKLERRAEFTDARPRYP